MVELSMMEKWWMAVYRFFAYMPSLLLLSSVIKVLSYILATTNTTKYPPQNNLGMIQI